MMTTQTADKAAEEAVAAAMHRLMTRPAIDLADLALLTGVHISTAQRAAAADRLPVPASRIGQRWVFPSASVRELLRVGAEVSA